MTFGDFSNSGFNNPFRGAGRAGGGRRRPGPLAITFIVFAVLATVLVSLSGFYTDYLWFKSVEFTTVWSTVLLTKAALFVLFGLLTALILTINIVIAYRKRPIYVPLSVEADNLERYRSQIEPIKKLITLGIFVAFFYFAGSSATNLWQDWLLFRNGEEFGATDPQFNLDISFFVFKLPFHQALIGWAISTMVLTLIATAIVHYLYGGIRPQVKEDRTTVAARVQLSVLLGIFVLLKAVAYWFDRYALALKESRLITGLTFTDVNAVLPAKAILSGVAVI